MNLIAELESITYTFNTNQTEFTNACKAIFENIDQSKIANSSKVKIEKGTLIIKLIHKLDLDTSVIIRVDKYEIYIICAGIGTSMFYQFPSLKGQAFHDAVKEYVRSALNGEFIKELYMNDRGKYIKGVLTWKNRRFKDIIFMSFWHKLKTLFFKEPLSKREFLYSSFFGSE